MSKQTGAAAEELGSRVAHARSTRGLTQRQLSDAARISVTFLSELENGKRNVSSEVLLRLSEALGVSADHLLRGAGTEGGEAPSFPEALSRAAERGGWSFAEAAALLAAHTAVAARRSRQVRGELDDEDWAELHRRFFGDGASR